MASKRPKLVELTTPRGVFRYPSIHEPDYGNEDYPKPEGQYRVSLILEHDDPKTQAFLEDLKPHYEEAMQKADEEFAKLPVGSRKKLKEVTQNPLFNEVYDPDTEEPTGEIEFRVGMAASGEYKTGPKKGQKWSRKPLVFDAQGNRIKNIPPIGSGSEGKLRVQLSPYFVTGTGVAGLKLRLAGVQLLELIEFGERSASSLGFEEEEGYVMKEEEPFDRGDDTQDDTDDEEGDF